MRWATTVWICLSAVVLAGCPEDSCKGNEDCMNGYSCTGGGKCVKTDPLRIVTSNIPDGVVGQEYQFTVVATGGIEPYTWVVETDLTWLSMQASSGNLFGTPTEVASGADVKVYVTDGSYGEGSEASWNFLLSVTLCDDSQVNPCSGNGSCIGGVCQCNIGYVGDQCEACDEGYHESQGECVIDEVCGVGSCSGHGSCDDSTKEIVCTCDDGYRGDYCDDCSAGYHDEHGECVKDEVCLENSCSGHGSCDDSSGMVVCACDGGYQGEKCGDCADGYHREGVDCVVNEVCEASSCSGHGTCDDTTGIVVCSCEEGYGGDYCESCAGGYHDEGGVCVQDETCMANSCSGHGTCDDNTGVVVCVCDVWYRGEYCEISVVDVLTPHDRGFRDKFSSSVAISGEYAIAGSPEEDGGMGDPVIGGGAAYIFMREGGNEWIEISKVHAPDSGADYFFGGSVAISGEYAIVGAVGGGVGGTAYIFRKVGAYEWDYSATLQAPDESAFDDFGGSVAISGDYAVVGARDEDGGDGDPLSGSGAAYIFGRTGTDSWEFLVKLVASDAQAQDSFGESVSISGDYVIVGSSNEDGGPGDPIDGVGTAYIFRRTGLNSWNDVFKIMPSDAQLYDHIGESVDISGDLAIVGTKYEDGGPGDPLNNAGAAYIFRRTGLNDWVEVAKLTASDAQNTDNYGVSVSISGDYAIVGASWEDGGIGNPLNNTGSAYIFMQTGIDVWEELYILNAPDAQPDDNFGNSVSIDGVYSIVGARLEDGGNGDPLRDTGAAYVFYP